MAFSLQVVIWALFIVSTFAVEPYRKRGIFGKYEGHPQLQYQVLPGKSSSYKPTKTLKVIVNPPVVVSPHHHGKSFPTPSANYGGWYPMKDPSTEGWIGLESSGSRYEGYGGNNNKYYPHVSTLKTPELNYASHGQLEASGSLQSGYSSSQNSGEGHGLQLLGHYGSAESQEQTFPSQESYQDVKVAPLTADYGNSGGHHFENYGGAENQELGGANINYESSSGEGKAEEGSVANPASATLQSSGSHGYAESSALFKDGEITKLLASSLGDDGKSASAGGLDASGGYGAIAAEYKQENIEDYKGFNLGQAGASSGNGYEGTSGGYKQENIEDYKGYNLGQAGASSGSGYGGSSGGYKQENIGSYSQGSAGGLEYGKLQQSLPETSGGHGFQSAPISYQNPSFGSAGHGASYGGANLNIGFGKQSSSKYEGHRFTSTPVKVGGYGGGSGAQSLNFNFGKGLESSGQSLGGHGQIPQSSGGYKQSFNGGSGGYGFTDSKGPTSYSSVNIGSLFKGAGNSHSNFGGSFKSSGGPPSGKLFPLDFSKGPQSPGHGNFYGSTKLIGPTSYKNLKLSPYHSEGGFPKGPGSFGGSVRYTKPELRPWAKY